MRKITLLAIILGTATVSFSQDAPAKSGSTVTDTILPFQRQELKEVKVVARKRLIEQKIDKMVVNVDAAVTNAGTTAMDVLEKSPGIQVDKDGNISLKGKQGVMVMIDGRPTYLTGTELANLLRGMESSQLEQIEIMTNPPAKYDAGGNSGVINIKTKKNKLKGFNGSVSANIGQGRYNKMNENLSLNYRNNKFNLFGNFSHGRYNNFNQLDIYRRYKNEDETTRAIF
ncbi:MAG: TonB-dependent receptor plug domain-containing protein, partial [Chitinophagaceae bacterium]|nr:TonB-dependent receptor plug domain-containing protein [Chitinophagaceae bacterium]